LEVGDKKMTKPLTQTSLFDDDDNEPLKDNSRPSDIFGKPKTSETNSDKKKANTSIFDDDDEDTFVGLFEPKKKETADPEDSIFG